MTKGDEAQLPFLWTASYDIEEVSISAIHFQFFNHQKCLDLIFIHI
jgi:hypothetical protein